MTLDSGIFDLETRVYLDAMLMCFRFTGESMKTHAVSWANAFMGCIYQRMCFHDETQNQNITATEVPTYSVNVFILNKQDQMAI